MLLSLSVKLLRNLLTLSVGNGTIGLIKKISEDRKPLSKVNN